MIPRDGLKQEKQKSRHNRQQTPSQNKLFVFLIEIFTAFLNTKAAGSKDKGIEDKKPGHPDTLHAFVNTGIKISDAQCTEKSSNTDEDQHHDDG